MATSYSSDNRSDDLGSLQRQVHEKKTDILESTRRMRGLVYESEAIGTGTAAELVDQREKLQNIEKRLDNIDGNLVVAQQNINKLSSIFGGIRNYFSPPKSAFHKSVSQPQISNGNKKKSSNPAATTTVNRTTNPKDDNDTYFGKKRSEMDDMERETEEGLQDIHEGVNRLKMLALHMNQELEDQKPLTDRIGVKMDRLTQDVTTKNKEMRAIALR